MKGGIDLSLANVLGLCAAVFTTLAQAGCGDGVAVLATIASGAVAGAANAVAVAVLGVLPLLATLVVMNICAGLELVLTHNTVVPASTPLLDALAGSYPVGVHYQVDLRFRMPIATLSVQVLRRPIEFTLAALVAVVD